MTTGIYANVATVSGTTATWTLGDSADSKFPFAAVSCSSTSFCIHTDGITNLDYITAVSADTPGAPLAILSLILRPCLAPLGAPPPLGYASPEERLGKS